MNIFNKITYIATFGIVDLEKQETETKRIKEQENKAKEIEALDSSLFRSASSPNSKTAEYQIIKASYLKPKDWIIHDGNFFFVTHGSVCKFMGPFDFGYAYYVRGFYKGSMGMDHKTITLFQSSPVIKIK